MPDDSPMAAEAVHAAWDDRSGEFSPDYYAHLGSDSASERVRAVLESTVDRGATILELGCSSGRHLAHLHDHGYRNLTGIDINREAAAVMATMFPALAEAGTFYFDPMETVLTDFEDDAFEVVYSVETLQHIHPDNSWVFEEIARITADRLITVELETPVGQPPSSAAPPQTVVDDDFPLYYRDWGQIFTDLGCESVAIESLSRTTLRHFRCHDP